MSTLRFVQTPAVSLYTGISASATSMRVTPYPVDLDGTKLTITDFGSTPSATIDPKIAGFEEIVTFTGITDNGDDTATLTGLVRNLISKSPYTTPGTGKIHGSSAVVVFSDNPQVYARLAAKENDETITGQWTFDVFPITPSTPKATEAVYGMTRLSVPAADPAVPIAVGANDTAAFQVYVPAGVMFPYAGSSAPTGFLLCDGTAVSRTTYAALFAIIGTSYGVGNGSTTFNLPDTRGRTMIGSGTGTKVATFASRASNVITVTGLTNAANNEFQTGQAVLYSAPSGAMTGLVDNTTYYLIRVSNTTFSLATTLANAQNGTVISLSSDGTGAQTFTLTLTARTIGDTGGEENHAMSLTELLSHTHTSPVYPTTTSGSDYGQGSNATGSPTSLPTNAAGGNAAMNNMQPFVGCQFIIKT